MQVHYLKRHQRLLIVASSFFLTLGITLLLYWPWLFEFIIKNGLALKPNSFAYQLWHKNPMPLYLECYMFNWTNPEDINKPNVKPRFEEVGPFRFHETKLKVNLTWNANGTVSFNHMKTWTFDRESSVSDLNVYVTTLNPVTVSASYQARHWGFWLKKGLQFTLSAVASKLHVTQKVGDILFHGYEDKLITLGNMIPFKEGPSMDKFGWFYARNNSYTAEGYYNMDTRPGRTGYLHRWNNASDSKYYGTGCSKLDGSAGELFERHPGNKISFFTSDMCRMVPLDFDEWKYVNGFHGKKFSASHSFLDNGTLIPGNECYCNGECLPSGLLNVSLCKFGAPGFVSLPHFYNADPCYINSVEGMKPNKDIHEMFITLEPTTGIPLEVAARLQLNLLLQPIQYLTTFEKVPRVVFPVLWFQQIAQLPDFLTLPFTLLLNLPTIIQVLAYILISVSSLILILVLYSPVIYLYRRRQFSRDKIYIAEISPLNVENGKLQQENLNQENL